MVRNVSNAKRAARSMRQGLKMAKISFREWARWGKSRFASQVGPREEKKISKWSRTPEMFIVCRVRLSEEAETKKKLSMIWLFHSPVTAELLFRRIREAQTMKPFFLHLKSGKRPKKGAEAAHQKKEKERKEIIHPNCTYLHAPPLCNCAGFLYTSTIASSSVRVLNCPSGYLIIHFMSLLLSHVANAIMKGKKVWCIHKRTYKHVVCINKTHSLCLSM